MPDQPVIHATALSKCFHLYHRPQDRLWELLTLGKKKYHEVFWALKNISFSVQKNETLGIIGRNGSGKSTLLQLICGILTPTTGHIQTQGRIAALLELGSGFNPEFTGKENVYLNAMVLGLTHSQINDRYQDILAFAEIGHFIEQPLKTYSSGMMLRLAFAVIAHVDADILVIDEALAVGDAFFTQKCMRFLREFMKTGTVIFVSHDTHAVLNLCDRAIWIEGGLLLESGDPKEICEHYLEAYHESLNGRGVIPAPIPKPISSNKDYDQRLKYIHHSSLRNDLEIFKFDPNAPSFGKGKGQIIEVGLFDEHQRPLGWVVGGEKVTLKITALCHQPLTSPIIGFFVKDKLGQCLFGENTFLGTKNSPIQGQAGETLQASFTFHMPILPPGDYSINAALADGTQETHEQQHWIHDAVLFKSHSSSVSTGLVGIPMHAITLENISLIHVT